MGLLSDVNLNEISFGKDGKSIKLSFIDMYEGESIFDLECLSVCFFDYQNCFDASDSLATYVGEVIYKEIDLAEASNYLKKHGYVFNQDEIFSDNVFFISVEGGEISLKIISGSVNFNNYK